MGKVDTVALLLRRLPETEPRTSDRRTAFWRLTCSAMCALALTGCEQTEHTTANAPNPNADALDPALAAARINTQYEQPCNQERPRSISARPVLGYMRLYAYGAEDAEVARVWWGDNVTSLPGYHEVSKRTGNTEGEVSGYVQLAPGAGPENSPRYFMQWSDPGIREGSVTISGCISHPKAQILDTTIDPANPKVATVVYSLDYPNIENGPPGLAPALHHPSSYSTITMAQSQRCSAEFNRLDATGWELRSYFCG